MSLDKLGLREIERLRAEGQTGWIDHLGELEFHLPMMRDVVELAVAMSLTDSISERAALSRLMDHRLAKLRTEVER